MAGGRDAILRVLEELSGSELRRLKAALNRLPVGEGYGTIPRGRMEGADALDLTDLLVGHYREDYGRTVTAAALRRIQRRDLAEALAGGDAARRLPADDLTRDLTDDLTSDLGAPSPAQLFVARHRLSLIQRVRGVGALLDHLEAGGVLTTEEAAMVAAGPTPPAQMRRLLATVPAWGRRGHDLFLGALRRLHPFLMEELEGGRAAGGGPQEAPEGPSEALEDLKKL